MSQTYLLCSDSRVCNLLTRRRCELPSVSSSSVFDIGSSLTDPEILYKGGSKWTFSMTSNSQAHFVITSLKH